MRVVVTTEHHFCRTPDGGIWTQTMFPYAYWKRYLSVFDGVRVVSRVRDVLSAPAAWIRTDGPDVSVDAVPEYLGPAQYLRRAAEVRKAVKGHLRSVDDAVLLYLHGNIASSVHRVIAGSGRPYGVYVIADPYLAFAPGATRHPARRFFRWWFTRETRRQCRSAYGVAYITERAFQLSYPPAADAVATYFSMGDMPDEAFVQSPRTVSAQGRPSRLVMVGSLALMYKAPDVLIDAINLCVRGGMDVVLVVVGDGQHRAELERRSMRLGLSHRVNFKGQLTTGEAVRAELDAADLFVLPSRQEGLPRAMIEAMARGLPCVGSTVGGVPELLEAEDMVAPGDPAALAKKIRGVLGDTERMVRMSARNLVRSREYRDEAVRGRRHEFYRALREHTERWRRGASAASGPVPPSVCDLGARTQL
jgi:glycosyltransferase involved in cell wall biosynthesis